MSLLMGRYVDCHNGVLRMEGSLAVSRATWDKHLARCVIIKPEAKRFKIIPRCQ